jgi:hypothetical protein
MKKNKKYSNKKIIFLTFPIFILLLLIFGIYFINSINPVSAQLIRELLPSEFKSLIKERVCLYKYYVPEFKNENIFPDTQFLKLAYHEIPISGLEARDTYFADKKKAGHQVSSFYIETTDDKIIIISINGSTLFYETEKLINKQNIKSKSIKNNLPTNITVDDTLIYKDKIFVSFRNRNKSCDTREIYTAKINFDFLNFKEFYKHGSNSKCKIGILFGGRMAIYNDAGDAALLVSTKYPNVENYPILEKYNKEIETIILLINIKTKKSRPISAGHRNPQGILVNEKNIILETEHGPKGGDEVNKIIEGENYGWPTSSYGAKYGPREDKLKYKKNHSMYNFKEPLYAFVPSIGISQIIKVPESFSKKWDRSYLITSLRSLSIYRVIFDEKYSRIITMEKIRVGKRIRDINYNEKYNTFFLALENESGDVGLLSIDNTYIK